jgi:hypothetical protein
MVLDTVLRCWRLRQPLHQPYDILDERDKDHQANCHVPNCGTELQGPDYAPGVNQCRSDNHCDECSQGAQNLFYRFRLLRKEG